MGQDEAMSQIPDDDFVLLVRHLSPTEATMLSDLLNAHGIAAHADDVHTVQMNSLWSPAMGGACVRVPLSRQADAQRVLDQLARGDFALDETHDVGEPATELPPAQERWRLR